MSWVLVTGGAGFIGSHVVERLRQQGQKVRVLDNLSTGRQHNLRFANPDGRDIRNLDFVHGDIRDPAVADQAVAGCSSVVHLAARVSVASSITDPLASAQHNVMGFVHIVNAMRTHGVKRLVYASSAAVYGNGDANGNTPGSKPEVVSPYGLEKSINEQYAQLFSKLYGQSCLGLRLFNVYGPRQVGDSPYAGVISRFTHQIQYNQPIHINGDGQQTRDYVYVADVARTLCDALRLDAQGVMDVGTGQPTSLLNVVHAMFEAFGRVVPVQYGPPLLGEIRASAAQTGMLNRLFSSWPRTPLAQGLRALAESLSSVVVSSAAPTPTPPTR